MGRKLLIVLALLTLLAFVAPPLFPSTVSTCASHVAWCPYWIDGEDYESVPDDAFGIYSGDKLITIRGVEWIICYYRLYRDYTWEYLGTQAIMWRVQ